MLGIIRGIAFQLLSLGYEGHFLMFVARMNIVVHLSKKSGYNVATGWGGGGQY